MSNLDKSTTGEPCILHNIVLLARIWGAGTIAVLWASGFTILQDLVVTDRSYLAWYLISSSLFITFLEITWIINMSDCCRNEGIIQKIWSGVMWLDDWKKGILYILISIPTFEGAVHSILAVVGGGMLVILACLYIIKTYHELAIQAALKELQRPTARVYIPSIKPQTVKLETNIQTEDDRYYGELLWTVGQERPLVTEDVFHHTRRYTE